ERAPDGTHAGNARGAASDPPDAPDGISHGVGRPRRAAFARRAVASAQGAAADRRGRNQGATAAAVGQAHAAPPPRWRGPLPPRCRAPRRLLAERRAAPRFGPLWGLVLPRRRP